MNVSNFTKKIATDYDLIAIEDSIPPTARLYDDAIISSLPQKCETIVDAGCGTGDLTIKLSNFAKNVQAFDISSKIIDVARSRNSHKNIRYAKGSIEELNNILWPSSCDSIIVNRSIHHCLDLRIVIKNLLNLIKPNGKLIILDLESTGIRKSDFHRNLIYQLYFLTVCIKGFLNKKLKQTLHELKVEKQLFNSNGWQQHLSHEPNFCWKDIDSVLKALNVNYSYRRINWKFFLFVVSK